MLQSCQDATNSIIDASSREFSDSSTETEPKRGKSESGSEAENDTTDDIANDTTRRVKRKTHAFETTKLHNRTPHMSKNDQLRTMFALSKAADLQKPVLSESVLLHRMACIRGMQQILQYSKTAMDGLRMSDNLVQESTVVPSIFLLDWIIANEFQYFMRMKTEALSAVCLSTVDI